MPDAERAVRFLEWSRSSSDKEGRPLHWDVSALKGIYDIRAEIGKVTCYFKVTPYYANHLGNLHGGVMATFTDTITSAALGTYSAASHVSLSINIDYLNAGLPGTVVRVEAEVIKPGKTVATIIAKFYDNATNRLLAQGSHVKYIQPGTGVEKPVIPSKQ